jgi:hypothetical protein
MLRLGKNTPEREMKDLNSGVDYPLARLYHNLTNVRSVY